MAMMTGARLGAERVIILDMDTAVAAERDQCGGANRDRVGAHRQRLGNIGPAADAARDDQLHFPMLPQLLERLDRLAQRRQGRNAGMLNKYLLGGAGPALHAIEDDDVGPRLDRELNIVVRTRRTDLDKDWLFPIRELAQLLNLDRQIVGASPVRMAAGATLINAGR